MEKPRYIDADEATNRIIQNATDEDILKLVVEIADCPTVDAVEVVRCKDCKFRYTETCFAKHETANDDYCSNGARMDGDDK